MGLFWLGLFIVFILVEVATVGLISIWFAGGALAALGVSALGIGTLGQTFTFIIVTIILLIFTKPIAEKYINVRREKTNYEGIIGKTAKVTERVDNINGTGAADYNGQIWTARCNNEATILEEGVTAKVVDIKGVKLILDKVQENTSDEL